MSTCYPFRPVPGQRGPRGCGPVPAPPFDPRDYWATKKFVRSLVSPIETSVASLQETKLDRSDVVDPAVATEAGKAADAKKTQDELNRILGVASDAKTLAESKADKLSDQQLAAVNSGIDADKVAKIAQNESAISAEVYRATTEEARLQALINAIKTFDAVVADSLPIPSEQYSKKLYLVPSTNPGTRNVKDEFICVNIADVWSWEQVGSTAITIEFDNEPTEGSQKAARSGGIWSWVKSLLPRWLTSGYAEPATVESVANKADKSALNAHVENTNNPHAVTAEQIGALGNSGSQTLNQSYNGLSVTFDAKGTLYTGQYAPSKWSITKEVNDQYYYVQFFGFNGTDYPSFNLFDGESDFYIRLPRKEGTLALQSDVESKVDKTTPYADGNLAALTADGNLRDSGKKAEDFAPAVDGGYLPLNVGGTVNGDTTFIGSLYAGPLGDILGVTHDAGHLYKHDSVKWYYGGWGNEDSNEIAVKGDVSSLASSKADLASLAPEYSATSAYSADEIVHHDGSFYQCKTAIAEGGEAWNAEHWELRKLYDFFTESNSLLTGTIDAEIVEKGTAPDAHLEAPTDERLKLVLADSSVAYDSAKALPYKLTSAIGDRVIATMTLTAASTDITLPTIAANDTTVKDFILDVTNAYAVEGVATDAGINIPRTDFKLVTRDGESLTDVTTVKAGKSAFICFTQKSPVVVDGTTYPCWCVIQLPFGDPS